MMLSTAMTGGAPYQAAYHTLPAWQRAMDLMAACYVLTRRLPVRDRLGLSLRHASLAVADGIATGVASRTPPRRLDHLVRAQRALREVEALLRTADERGCLDRAEQRALARLVDETRRCLHDLSRAHGGAALADDADVADDAEGAADVAHHSRPPNSSARTRASIAPV